MKLLILKVQAELLAASADVSVDEEAAEQRHVCRLCAAEKYVSGLQLLIIHRSKLTWQRAGIKCVCVYFLPLN